MNRFLPKLSYPYDSILAKNRVNGHAKRLAFPFVRSKRLIGKAKIQQSLNGRKSDVSKYTADAVRKAPNITRNLMSVKKVFDVMWTCGTVFASPNRPPTLLKSIGGLIPSREKEPFSCA